MMIVHKVITEHSFLIFCNGSLKTVLTQNPSDVSEGDKIGIYYTEGNKTVTTISTYNEDDSVIYFVDQIARLPPPLYA